MAAAGLPPAFRSAATSPNKEKEAGGAILIICVRRPFLRSGRRMGKPFDENRSRNCRRQSQHGPLGLGSRPSSPRVSSLANRQVTRQPSLHLRIRAAERRSGMDGQHSGRYHDSKRKARAFIGTLKRNNSAAVLREELWVPYSKVVRHDAIITPSNPDLPVIKDSLREFLGQIH
jgi:hypothetical protein